MKKLATNKQSKKIAKSVALWVQQAAKDAERATGITFEQFAKAWNRK